MQPTWKIPQICNQVQVCATYFPTLLWFVNFDNCVQFFEEKNSSLLKLKWTSPWFPGTTSQSTLACCSGQCLVAYRPCREDLGHVGKLWREGGMSNLNFFHTWRGIVLEIENLEFFSPLILPRPSSKFPFTLDCEFQVPEFLFLMDGRCAF